MAFVSGKNWRCVLNWSDSESGGNAINAIGIATATVQTPLEVFTVLDANVTQAMWDWAGPTAKIVSVDVEDLAGVIATQSFATGAPAKWSGGGIGQTIPQVAGIVKLTTGLRGRSFRGRVFIPFVGEGEQEGGIMDDASTVGAAWTTFMNALAALVSPEYQLAITSRKLSEQNAVQAILAETHSATQRRRQDRLRP